MSISATRPSGVLLQVDIFFLIGVCSKSGFADDPGRRVFPLPGSQSTTPPPIMRSDLWTEAKRIWSIPSVTSRRRRNISVCSPPSSPRHQISSSRQKVPSSGMAPYAPQPFQGLSIDRPRPRPDSPSSPKQDIPSPRSGVDWPRLTPHSAGMISPRFSPQ